MHDIITIGAATRDVFVLSDQFQILSSPKFATGKGECVSLGSKIEIDELVFTTGGGATNAAATFASLGLRAACAGKVGDDDIGEEVLKDLAQYGIDTSLMKRAKGQTAYSVLLTHAKTGERSVLVHRGVSKTLTPADLPLGSCLAKWFYLTSFGGNIALVKRVLAQAKRCKASVAWNPGSAEIKKGFAAIKPLLKDVRIFNLNREEAKALTKTDDLAMMFQKLAVNPKGVVLISDGAKGAYAHANGTTWHAGTTDAKAVSRTGAGDAFGSGFAASYMKDGDIPKALAIGTLNAEGVIGSIGAKKGILKKWPTKAQMKRIEVARTPKG